MQAVWARGSRRRHADMWTTAANRLGEPRPVTTATPVLEVASTERPLDPGRSTGQRVEEAGDKPHVATDAVQGIAWRTRRPTRSASV